MRPGRSVEDAGPRCAANTWQNGFHSCFFFSTPRLPNPKSDGASVSRFSVKRDRVTGSAVGRRSAVNEGDDAMTWYRWSAG
ncbi:hypothetical protein BRADI_3g22488v3 [Brachypodium distachyon]|uniref:Uncharacterized protein n=1 Tax=Brachypodium distachyon TaxID=15368 RepID=A0A2K2CYU7_BRADI|nr:hypothetical protein BRADI_3g22488v3 [Brachypodium distachyon]